MDSTRSEDIKMGEVERPQPTEFYKTDPKICKCFTKGKHSPPRIIVNCKAKNLGWNIAV